MKTGIRIEGGDVEPASVEAILNAVKGIFKTGQKTNMDQETIRAGLALVQEMAVVKGTTISNCVVGDSPTSKSSGEMGEDPYYAS